MAEKTEASIWRALRGNLWIVSAFLSVVFTGAFTFVSRQFLQGLATAAFLLAALLFWVVVLVHAISRVYEPIKMMTLPDRGGRILDREIQKIRHDFMKEIGITVIGRAFVDDEGTQQRLSSADAARRGVRIAFSGALSEYEMDEETLSEVGALVRAIDVIQDMRSVLRKAQSAWWREGVVLPLWWPVVILVAVFITLLPQDLNVASLAFIGLVGAGYFLWAAYIVPDFESIGKLHKRVMRLQGGTHQEIKRRIEMIALEEAE